MLSNDVTSDETLPRATQKIVLVGGGHTHVGVLRSFIDDPIAGVQVTVIAKELAAPYSGMLPGFVAGHYTEDACHIDLVALARAAGATVVHGTAVGIDRQGRHVRIADHAPLPYDILSLDVGITPNLDEIAGARDHALAVKPVSAFAEKWTALAERLGKPGETSKQPDLQRVFVIGGGAAGFELALAVVHRFLNDPHAPPVLVTLVAGAKLLADQPRRARRLAKAALDSAKIELIEDDRVVAVTPTSLTLNSGRTRDAAATIVATGAKAPAWFDETDLPRAADGSIATRPTLQVLDDAHVFAVGDCASIVETPRPKAGVFAVRQAKPLDQNIRALVSGDAVTPFVPQERYLKILSLGVKRAIATRNGITLVGTWVWWLKDWIDQRFMSRHNFSDH